MSEPGAAASTREQNLRWALRQVEDALRNLRFGALTLLVQDGVIVQLERTERQRYRRPASEVPETPAP